MPTRDSDHVVAIDFSPHTEAMQTDTLLETGMQSGVGVNASCCDSGPKRMMWFVLAVGAFVIVIMILSNL